MRKSISQDFGIYKKFAATYRISGMPPTSPVESVRLLSVRVPIRKKPLSTQLHCLGELDLLQGYPVRVMPHQKYTAQLGQQINQIILNSFDDKTLLQQTAQAVGKAFRVDCCLVIVTAENQVTDQIGCWHSDKNSPMLSPQEISALGQLATLIGTGCEPLAIDDVHAVETSLLTQVRTLPISAKAILAIPTWFQGKTNGIVFLIQSQPHGWSEAEKSGALAIAASVAIAISHVRQTKLLASLQQQVDSSAQSKTLINQLAIAIRGSSNLEQILELALLSAAQALQVDRGLILTFKYADPLFKTRERRGKIPKAKVKVVCEWLSDSEAAPLGNKVNSALNQSFWLSECLLCQQAFTNSPSPIVVSDKNSLAAIAPVTDTASLFQLSTLPSVLIFPLENQGTILGLLVLQQPGDRLWHSEELALVEMVSALVSTAIIQSQTLRQVQSLVDERTAQLQRSLEVQGKLYEKTRQQVDQLRQLNQLKDEFVSTMNHELRTPLTSMNLAIRMLRQPGISAERQSRYLDILEQQCNQEIQLIHDLLKLQELESNKTQLKLETIDLKSKLDKLAQSFTEKWADKGLTITLDLPQASLLVQTDSDSIERILQELLTNAGKYSDPDTNVVLRATHQIQQQSNQFVLNLTNTGAGIAPEDITHIFDKFRRGQGVTQQAIQGTGLGLTLVKCLVQQLNGTIDVSSIATDDSASHETCFTLTLPQSFAPRSTPV